MHVAELVTPFGCGLIDVGEFRYGTTWSILPVPIRL